MVITKIEIENIRSLEQVLWEIEPEQAKGWHVILGDNGAGKSTFLRAVALALVGPKEAAALRQNWEKWLRFESDFGRISILIDSDGEWDAFFNSLAENISGLEAHLIFGGMASKNQRIERGLKISPIGVPQKPPYPDSFIWGNGHGWFSASYGPFRRFSGGDQETERIFSSNPSLARHLSIFGENTALSEVVKWLQDLQFKALENRSEKGLLTTLIGFINQPGFLPHGVQLREVSSDGVRFSNADGNLAGVEELSDGYRSILSMTFEIIRQLVRTYGQDRVFDSEDPSKIIAPGVVLIDEIDVHLHPSWQREVGHWFRRHFPNIQFIVTTHSPLVCQAATEGSIFRLPTPGTDEQGGMVTGIELERLLKGNIMEAYDTPSFGLSLTRSDESKDAMKRLAQLNVAEMRRGLTEAEIEEQEKLRATLPTTAHITPGSLTHGGVSEEIEENGLIA